MLSDRIHELRLAAGLTQVSLANELNVTKQCVSNWENDNILPSIDVLVRLAKYFGVSTDYLLGLDDVQSIRVEGLSPSQRAHIQALINDLLSK